MRHPPQTRVSVNACRVTAKPDPRRTRRRCLLRRSLALWPDATRRWRICIRRGWGVRTIERQLFGGQRSPPSRIILSVRILYGICLQRSPIYPIFTRNYFNCNNLRRIRKIRHAKTVLVGCTFLLRSRPHPQRARERPSNADWPPNAGRHIRRSALITVQVALESSQPRETDVIVL